MGYVNDANMCQWIPPSNSMFSAGTWTDVVNSNVWSKSRTAADASSVWYIPITLPSNAKAFKGAYLKSIDIYWDVNTAALDALQADLYMMTLPVNGSLPTAAAVTTTYDTGHDTAGERLTMDEHKLTLTLATPAWIDEDEAYHVEVNANAAATSAIFYFGARANFTLRL